MVGDIVERNTVDHSLRLRSVAIAPIPALRPVRAVVGQAFPLVHTRRSYGRASAPTLEAPHATAPRSSAGMSAHVQPQDGAFARPDNDDGDGQAAGKARGTRQPLSAMPAGGSAQQHLPAHQWSAAEFEHLRCGYYVAAVINTAAADTDLPGTLPTGENFFVLLFQCLRSTVRKHQQLALAVLLAHLRGLAVRGGVTVQNAPAVGTDRLAEEAAALRLRCLHGPNCGPFLFFLLEVLVSAGHPAMVELATTCLLLLLRGLPRGGAAGQSGDGAALEGCESVALLTDAIGEFGNPAADAPHREEDGVTAAPATPPTHAEQDDAELPFSEVSELLRGPDARYGLEQLGFTNKVLATMNLLLYTSTTQSDDAHGAAETRLPACHGEVLFLELLLCGGVGIGHRAACQRVAGDPHFLSWVEGRLSAVVLGHCPLADVMEVMCVVQHLAHSPAALQCLMRGSCGDTRESPRGTGRESGAVAAASQQQQRFRETWLLFFLYVCSTAVDEVRTVRHAFTVVWSMLLLRTCARQTRQGSGAAPSSSAGPAFGLVHDLSDTLLAEGMAVGGALVLEMWFLQYAAAEGSMGGTQQPKSLDAYFLDAARTALQLCRQPVSEGGTNDVEGVERDTAKRDAEATTAQSLMHSLRWTACAHFFATYVGHLRQHTPAACYTLSGSAVETQETMRWVVRHVVVDASRIPRAFQRLTSPLLSPSFEATAHSSSGSWAYGTSALSIVASITQQGWAAAVDTVLRRWLASPASSAASPPSFTAHNTAVLHLAADAAALYANTRLAAALADVYPAVARELVGGYAAVLVQAFETACLRLRDAAPLRLQVDELATMTEAVQLLQRCGARTRVEGGDGGAGEGAQVHYDREARVGAFFLVHSIALSKHCLDVVPLLLPLFSPSAGTAPARLALLVSLQSGIELAPVAATLSSSTAVAVTGGPRSWVLHPLYDATFAAKDVWAAWLRGLLGLHKRVKDVVGWDAVLSHTLLWVLTHRRTLWATERESTSQAETPLAAESAEGDEREEVVVTPASASALCALLFDLCALLHDQCDGTARGDAARDGGQTSLSAAASRTLEVALSAYSDVPSEASLPLLPHAALAYVAAHCSPRAALAALQVLLVTPLLPPPSEGAPCTVQPGQGVGEKTAPPSTLHESWPNVAGEGSSFPQGDAAAQVCAWLRSWAAAEGERQLSAASACWSLNDFVALLQLVAPHLNGMGDVGGDEGAQRGDFATLATPVCDAWGTDKLWCVRCLTKGLVRGYVHQRRATCGRLSEMEKAVLSSTLEELAWYPSMLWSHVTAE